MNKNKINENNNNNIPKNNKNNNNTTDKQVNQSSNELKVKSEELIPQIYVDKDGKLSCEIRVEKKKIKTNLKLPAIEVTYLRYILDSQFIPVSANIIKTNSGIRVRIKIHNH